MKISGVYLEKGPMKSRLAQNVSDGWTDLRTDGQTNISNYRVASLLKI